MEIIKLGDRICIPSKHIKGEVAYIGKTHFADGTWFGIILDDPTGKHDGTIDNKRYFKSAKNHGMFIKTSFFEKECFDISSSKDKRCNLIQKRKKYPINAKIGLKLKEETTSAASECITNGKIKIQSKNTEVLENNVTNSEKNAELIKINEVINNNNDFAEKKTQAIRKYPNHLKASYKVKGNNFCLNKNKGNKTDNETDDLMHNNENAVLPITESNDNPDKDENESSRRIIYPNYLKASSKLAGKHFCVAKRNDVNDNVINDTEKPAEIQAKCEVNNVSENPYAHLIKYPYHPKTSFNNKQNDPNSAKQFIASKPKSLSKNDGSEISKNNQISDVSDRSTELEAVKYENDELKNKIKSIEASLEEFVNKYNEAQEEIKHLKYNSECQRKQIKFQKNHLKLLKMSQGNNLMQAELNNRESKQKKIEEILEIALNIHGNDANTCKDNCDSENPKQRVLELEKQNRLMIQGLIELRNFLKKQCESQSLEPLNLNSNSHLWNSSSATYGTSEFFDSSLIQNSEECATEEAGSQLREYSEILREMTKFNEVMNEKRGIIQEWEANNSVNDNLHPNPVLNDAYHPFSQSNENASYVSDFNINGENYDDVFKDEIDVEALQNSLNLKQNDIQKSYLREVDQMSQPFSQKANMQRKLNKHHVEDIVPLEPADCFNKISHYLSNKNHIYNENTSFSSTTIMNEQDVFENEASECNGIWSSKISEDVAEPCHSTNLSSKSSGDSPMVSKSNISERKMSVSTELRHCREMGSIDK